MQQGLASGAPEITVALANSDLGTPIYKKYYQANLSQIVIPIGIQIVYNYEG